MDFFRSQEAAKRRTRGFLVLFVIVVLLVALTSAFFLVLIFSDLDRSAPPLILGLAVIIMCIIMGGMASRSWELFHDGGISIAEHLGGEPLPTGRMTEPELQWKMQRLQNVVEEMAIASGTPMPSLYWLPDEPSINAFVAGLTPADAVLAVTRGALEQLNRDELQGVVAHEFGHLLNGDMRLNSRLSCWLFGIFSLYILGSHIIKNLSRTSGSGGGKGSGNAILLILAAGVMLMLIGYLGKMCGRLLQAAVSRQREYLADASAVQFTRQKDGLAGALKKTYFSSGSQLQTANADNYNHLFLNDGVKVSQLLASHPPLVDRIRALDKSFDPNQIPIFEKEEKPAEPRPEKTTKIDRKVAAAIGSVILAGATAEAPETFNMRDGLALLFANLWERSDIRACDKQFQYVKTLWGDDIAQETRKLSTKFLEQPVYERLRQLRMMLVHLHELSDKQKEQLRKTIFILIAANEKISLHEAAVVYMIESFLSDMARPTKVKMEGKLPYAFATDSIKLLKELVIDHPQVSAEELTLKTLGQNKENTSQYSLRAVKQAFDQLNQLSLSDKKRLFEELSGTNEGKKLTENQKETLSLIAICLHAPPLEAMIS